MPNYGTQRAQSPLRLITYIVLLICYPVNSVLCPERSVLCLQPKPQAEGVVEGFSAVNAFS